LVGALLEFPSGVQSGEDGGQTGQLRLVDLVDGDAAPVVDDGHSPVGTESDVDAGGVAGHRLVHRVVHDLPHEVMQTPGTGAPDVHAGAEPNRLETLEDGDVFGRIRLARRRHKYTPYDFLLRPGRILGRAPRTRLAGPHLVASAGGPGRVRRTRLPGGRNGDGRNRNRFTLM